MDKFVLLLLSFFNVGRFKYAPGTVASIFASFLWYHFPNVFFLQFSVIIFLVIISILLCFYYNKKIQKDDPSFIVVDEICGMCIALFMIPKSYILFLISFLLFRFFDIFKPLYIYRSQKIDYGIGIVLDDILAGLYTLFIMNVIIYNI